MSARTLAPLTLLAVAGLAACSPPATTQTCGTTDVPPIAADRSWCDRAAPGVRWYVAPVADVSEPDEQPVIGQELDGDWWDPAEQADLSDSHKPRRPSVATTPGPRSAPTTTAAPASPRRTTAPAAPARPSTSGRK
jgi:hypothetical protein